MAISEKIELLGKNIYKDIPGELTLTSIPTGSELDYIGAEDFDQIMLDKVLPKCIEEHIDPKKLLEIDYQWILRCLRIINYGPYINVGAIVCDNCGEISRGDYMVNLNSVECIPLPDNFTNSVKISKDEFISFNQDIVVKLLTIDEVLAFRKDKQFQDSNGRTNNRFARMCYEIVSIGNESMNPIEARIKLKNDMESADYILLQDKMAEVLDFGLRGGGTTRCPKCGSDQAAYAALTDERFFRPTVAALRKWRDDRNKRSDKNVSRAPRRSVQQHN